MLNHRAGTRLELRDVDFDCLDVIVRHGPLGPGDLARRTGVHLATMTGILDRLEAGGWITRERAETDRRAVVVKGVASRQREVIRLFDGMNTALDGICEQYSDGELAVIVDFLRRSADAGRSATDELARGADARARGSG